jgi:hypothetical protein
MRINIRLIGLIHFIRARTAITEHASISYAEAAQADNLWIDILMTAGDFNPLLPISLGNTYACVKCKKIRFEGGFLSNQANKSSSSRL